MVKQSRASGIIESIRADVKQSRASGIIESIRADIESGYGIVPILGSGISAQSGIPAGSDYQAYLFHCVSRLFARGGGRDQMWDPGCLRWPPYTSAPIYKSLADEMVEWTQGQMSTLSGDNVGEPAVRALWQSLGAVADWRAMLNLLSRTRVSDNEIQIVEPDPRIIDSFFTNLTEGKRPNTAHMLLAHLADVLRLRVILTTNFDTLLEEAFRQLEMPVAAFDVHYDAGFPDGRSACAQRSIVKINGGRYGLRADFTLDRLPDAADFERFTSCLVPLSSTARRSSAADAKSLVRQRNLLVMGVSGQERRTIALICQAMLNVRDLNTYWVCHQQGEIEGVAAAFAAVMQAVHSRMQAEPPVPPADALANVTVAATPDVGLFLLHLYQRMFLCLPPSGVPFKAVWPLPPPPYELAREDSGKSYAVAEAKHRLQKGVATVTEAIAGVHKRPDSGANWPRVILVTGESGVPSVAAQVFLEGNDARHRIWVDIEEGWHAVDLAAAVLDAIRLRVGIAEPLLFGLTESSFQNDQKLETLFKNQFKRLKRFSRRHFLIFINGRDRPGKGTDPDTTSAIPVVLSWLAAEDTVTVVVLGWDGISWTEDVASNCPGRLKLAPLLEVPPECVTADRILGCLNELPEGPERFRFAGFLAALSLFRRPCYLSVTNAWPLVALSSESGDVTPVPDGGPGQATANRFLDKDQRRHDYVADGRANPTRESYLDRLRRVGAIRDDDGQTLLMHRRVREELRKRLLGGNLLPDPGWDIRAHQGIADWYLKLYRASGDVAAGIESFYHRIECIRAARRHDDKYMWESAATEARVTLRLMRPALAPPVLQSYLARRRLDELCGELAGLSKDIGSPNLNKTVTEVREQLDYLKAQWEGTSTSRSAARTSHSDSILRVEPLDEIRRLVDAREYTQAEGLVRGYFAEIGFAPAEHLGEDDPRRSNVRYDKCRDEARKWAEPNRDDQAKLGKAVRLLRRYHSLCILRAELYDRLACKDERLKALMIAEASYVCATELMRNIDDVRFVQNENAYLRANQGLALSWMNRPREAHRRYNEAYGYLNQMQTPPMSLRFATIDARRAESFLHYVRHPTENSVTEPAQSRGLLQDAIGAVERASYKSVDQPYPRWHSYLAALTMEVCCQIARQGPDAEGLYARARDRSGYGEWFYSCFEAGFHAVGEDPVRLCHYVRLAGDFTRESQAFSNDTTSGMYLSADCLARITGLRNECLSRLGTIKRPSDPQVRDYVFPPPPTPPPVKVPSPTPPAASTRNP